MCSVSPPFSVVRYSHETKGFFPLHGLIADEFLDDLLLWPDSLMSHKDISFLYGLIADESSDLISLWLDSHMSYKDISSLRVLTQCVWLYFLSLLLDSHMIHSDIFRGVDPSTTPTFV